MEEKRRISGTSRTAGASSSTDTSSSHDETKKEKPWESGRVVASDSPYTRCAAWEEHGGGIEALLARVIQNPNSRHDFCACGSCARGQGRRLVAKTRRSWPERERTACRFAWRAAQWPSVCMRSWDSRPLRASRGALLRRELPLARVRCTLHVVESGAGELAPRRSRLQVCSAERGRTRERTVDMSVIPGVFIWDSRAGGVCFFFFFLFPLSFLHLHLWSM